MIDTAFAYAQQPLLEAPFAPFRYAAGGRAYVWPDRPRLATLLGWLVSVGLARPARLIFGALIEVV